MSSFWHQADMLNALTMSACRREADISDYDVLFAKASADVINLYTGAGEGRKSHSTTITYVDIGGPRSCAIGAPKQHLSARCGRKCLFEARRVFSAAPAPELPALSRVPWNFRFWG